MEIGESGLLCFQKASCHTLSSTPPESEQGFLLALGLAVHFGAKRLASLRLSEKNLLKERERTEESVRKEAL